MCNYEGKDMQDIWLFSLFCDNFGGSSSVLREIKDVFKKENVDYRHAWVTNFSAEDNAKDVGLHFKALPLPAYVNNFLAGLKWRKSFRKESIALVADGSPVAGAIPFAAQIPYILCFATSLADEYAVRSLRRDFADRNFSLVLNKICLGINRHFERQVLKNARAIIGLSPYTIRSLNNDYHISMDKMNYLPFPIAPKSRIGERTFNPCGPRLLAVGRVDDYRKNYDFLLQAFQLVIKKYPESRLRIAGAISPSSKVLSRCKELQLTARVDFLGPISNDKLQLEFAAADIFVLTPRQEGLGIVYLEAMSYGVPVVTTKCGGSEGIVADGLNGYLVDQGDGLAFLTAIGKVWLSEESYRQLSNQAKDFIEKEHRPEVFQKKLLSLLRDVK